MPNCLKLSTIKLGGMLNASQVTGALVIKLNNLNMQDQVNFSTLLFLIMHQCLHIF